VPYCQKYTPTDCFFGWVVPKMLYMIFSLYNHLIIVMNSFVLIAFRIAFSLFSTNGNQFHNYI